MVLRGRTIEAAFNADNSAIDFFVHSEPDPSSWVVFTRFFVVTLNLPPSSTVSHSKVEFEGGCDVLASKFPENYEEHTEETLTFAATDEISFSSNYHSSVSISGLNSACASSVTVTCNEKPVTTTVGSINVVSFTTTFSTCVVDVASCSGLQEVNVTVTNSV
jgi:hypothetical protein